MFFLVFLKCFRVRLMSIFSLRMVSWFQIVLLLNLMLISVVMLVQLFILQFFRCFSNVLSVVLLRWCRLRMFLWNVRVLLVLFQIRFFIGQIFEQFGIRIWQVVVLRCLYIVMQICLFMVLRMLNRVVVFLVLVVLFCWVKFYLMNGKLVLVLKKCQDIMLLELMKCLMKLFGLVSVWFLKVGWGRLFRFLKLCFWSSLVRLCFRVILKFGWVLKEVNMLLVCGFIRVMYIIGNLLFSEVFLISIGKFCFFRLWILVRMFGYLVSIFGGMFGSVSLFLRICCLIVCLKIFDRYCICVLVRVLLVFMLLLRQRFLIRLEGKYIIWLLDWCMKGKVQILCCMLFELVLYRCELCSLLLGLQIVR